MKTASILFMHGSYNWKALRYKSRSDSSAFQPNICCPSLCPSIGVLKKHIYILNCFSLLYIFRFVEAAASEGEDSSCEDSKSAYENEAKKARVSETTEKRQPAIGKLLR